MTNDGDERFTPRPRVRRKRVSVSAHEKIDRLRAVLARLGEVTADALADPDGPLMLQVEAAISRADSIVQKLPQEVRDRLDEDVVRGLSDTRDVAARGYAQLDPHTTADIINSHLPAFLDELDKALAGEEADG